MSDLVTEQEFQVVQESGTSWIIYGSELLVCLSVCTVTAIHARKQHLAASHHYLGFAVGYFIFVFLFVQFVDWFFVDQVLNFCIVLVTKNEWAVPVLLPVQVGEKCKDIFRTVFIHWRTSQGAYDDQRIGRVTDYDNSDAQQHCIPKNIFLHELGPVDSIDQHTHQEEYKNHYPYIVVQSNGIGK